MDEKSQIRVIIADDHGVVRSSLAMLIKAFDGIMLVGEAVNGVEAIELCAQLEPDVVLMDLAMPEMDGVAATRILRETYPKLGIVAMTILNDYELMQAALDAGANDCLKKGISLSDLATAIRQA